MPDESQIRHSESHRTDTFRDDHSSGERAEMTPSTPSMIGQAPPQPNGALTADTCHGYCPPMTANLHSVITAMNINRPGLSVMKRNLLLFFAQGHYLARSGDAMFAEALYATDDGVDLDDSPQHDAVEQPSSGVLNTINTTLMRYADLSPADLRTLIQASQPWQLARKSSSSPRIEWVWLTDWFTRPEEIDDPDDERPTRTQIAAWSAD